MTWFDNIGTRNKTMALVLAALLGMAAIFVVALLTLQDSMLADRKDKIEQMTETAYAIVAHYHAEALSGKRPEADAKQAALSDLRQMRYGKGDYFFVIDMTPTMLMHPIKPDLEGQSVANQKTPGGHAMFVEMAELVRKQGAGLYTYHWPKPGFSAPVRKLAFVRGFAPWGWVLSTGIYLDDVDSAFWHGALIFGGLMAIITGLMLGLSLWVAGRLAGPLRDLTASMAQLSAGTVDIIVDGGHRRDEIGEMSRALLVFQESERQRRDLAQKQ